jgi:hypothetical protein
MRWLLKADYELTDPVETERAAASRSRRRIRGRTLLIVAGSLLVGLLSLQLCGRARSGAPGSDDAAARLSSMRGRTASLSWRLQERVNRALPPGRFGTIVKMAAGLVAAAVFLRMPTRV